MPENVAWSFITNADHLKCGYINVAFEDRNGFSEDYLLHILQEYSLEIPALDMFMNLFVANSEKSCMNILAYLRRSIVDGRIVQPGTGDNASRRFDNLTTLKKVLSGFIKIIPANSFARLYPCNCPGDGLRWCFVDQEPNPVVTKFMHDISHRYDCFGSKHPLSLLRCFNSLLPTYDLSKQLNATLVKKDDDSVSHSETLVKKEEDTVSQSSSWQYDSHASDRHSECKSVPVLRPDGRAQQRYSFGNKSLVLLRLLVDLYEDLIVVCDRQCRILGFLGGVLC